jgi:hypothetical protein
LRYPDYASAPSGPPPLDKFPSRTIVRFVLSVRGAFARRRVSGTDHFAGQPAGSMVRQSQLAGEAGLDAASAIVPRKYELGRLRGAVRAHYEAPSLMPAARVPGERRKRRDDGSRPVPGPEEPSEAAETPRWARRRGDAMARKAIATSTTPCASRRAPTPRCEATGAQLGLLGAARIIRRGCLIIESEAQRCDHCSVIRGPDPRIHRAQARACDKSTKRMDRRVKPGDDGVQVMTSSCRAAHGSLGTLRSRYERSFFDFLCGFSTRSSACSSAPHSVFSTLIRANSLLLASTSVHGALAVEVRSTMSHTARS